ncbi:type IV pilus twitching motility protein PilT [Thermicanus aegyptius]|uniref:type IV pilus twitching motility protein PilT n=1 Tax=Thermicanus aegyptius TaxID=94009 RepID=UPI000426DA9A|nr:type IV pilus twitching motility protein PilT [Thermicanus aegyptius]
MSNTQQIFEEWLGRAFEAGASDLHLSIGSPPILRIDGALTPLEGEKITAAFMEELPTLLLNELQQRRFLESGEVDFSYSLPGISRYRVNLFRQRGGVSIAARVIPSHIPSLGELQMPKVLREVAEKPHGLFLVTGPTGSGKSTTLAAMINHINETQAKHIITLEDPIEYLRPHKRSIVEQREIGNDTMSFASGLRASLRQDPDVILVGEMRDLETISTAITAAETGHLVLATLHTNDAAQTVDRIIDVFPAEQQGQIRLQVAEVLIGILSMRLLPLATGKGRVAATEILINTPAAANLIRQSKSHQLRSLMQTGRAMGMHTMEMHIRELLAAHLISPAVAGLYLTEG